MREKRVYDVLVDVQGSVVPKYLGLFGSVQGEANYEETWIVVMEDAGRPIQRVTEDVR